MDYFAQLEDSTSGTFVSRGNEFRAILRRFRGLLDVRATTLAFMQP